MLETSSVILSLYQLSIRIAIPTMGHVTGGTAVAHQSGAAQSQSRTIPEEAGWGLQPVFFPDPLSTLSYQGFMACPNLIGCNKLG